MLNISRIQLELEKAKEGLREVEETIQKVEGKAFVNGPGRYGNLKAQMHAEKNRNPISNEDGKLQRRVIASNIEPRNRRISSDDLSFNLKRGPRDKKDSGLKRQILDNRPQSISARVTGPPIQQAVDDEDDEEFTKKLTIPSRVITTAVEAPSRQEVIAAQTGDELIKQRNRRMFGALVGTLQKFCKEETRVREREEKRLKVEKKLEEDAKREKEKLLQEKRELFLERKRREIEIKRIEWSLNRVKEYEAWEAHVMPLKNFIQTHAKPHIFYLPSVHNNKTQERLAHSQKIVARMMERRKNNLKEEIENSERKARRTVAEEEDEEEAENIPQNSESVKNAEEPMEIDFDTVNKENGFHENDSKTKKSGTEHSEKSDDATNEKKWDKKDAEIKGNADLPNENKSKDVCKSKQDEMEESDTVYNVCGSSEVPHFRRNTDGDSDGEDGIQENENSGRSEAVVKERTFEVDEDDTKENDYTDKAEKSTNESDTDEVNKVPISESENSETLTLEKVSVRKEETQSAVEDNFLKSKTEENVSDSEKEKKDDPDENVKKLDDKDYNSGKDIEKYKDKSNDSFRRKEKSPSKKSLKRPKNFRSPTRRSKSPRRFSVTRRRSRSVSRKRKSFRKRSKSHSKSASPSKKSRRTSSPKLRRHSERTSSRMKSSHSKSKRRNSSRSSGSASPKKRMKFRSASRSNSKSDSD